MQFFLEGTVIHKSVAGETRIFCKYEAFDNVSRLGVRVGGCPESPSEDGSFPVIPGLWRRHFLGEVGRLRVQGPGAGIHGVRPAPSPRKVGRLKVLGRLLGTVSQTSLPVWCRSRSHLVFPLVSVLSVATPRLTEGLDLSPPKMVAARVTADLPGEGSGGAGREVQGDIEEVESFKGVRHFGANGGGL